MSTANERRDAAFDALASETFDLLVVGGGVVGCGVARDAALRGLKVALVEKRDFASGTSSKSSKLIHGGLRYLEHAQFRLVFEGTNERALLLRLAPHLVKPLKFMVPAYKESRPGLIKLDVGLWIYDALSKFKPFPVHKTYRPKALAELEPLLRTEELKGSIVYHDCMTDDARLTLENAIDARVLGAVMLNHARVEQLVKDPEGRIRGAVVRDGEPGSTRAPIQVKAHVVMSATGPWTDELRELAGQPRMLKPTKGIHLVVDRKRLPINHALVMLARRDHRVTFAIPWEDRTVLGTTDTFFDGSPDRVYATKDDANYMLETTNHYFPAAQLTLEDVLATWAGLRPLVAPESGSVDTSDISREHHVLEQPGLVTIAGGKLTTYRRIAAEAVDKVVKQLGKTAACSTAERSLPGAVGIAEQAELDDLAESLQKKGLSEPISRHLANTYGVRATELAGRVKDGGERRLDPELPWTEPEVEEAVDEELARSLVDVLGRRIPLILRSRDQGLAAAPRVAQLMAERLAWSPARVQEELARYRAEVDDSRRFRTEG